MSDAQNSLEGIKFDFGQYSENVKQKLATIKPYSYLDPDSQNISYELGLNQCNSVSNNLSQLKIRFNAAVSADRSFPDSHAVKQKLTDANIEVEKVNKQVPLIYFNLFLTQPPYLDITSMI